MAASKTDIDRSERDRDGEPPAARTEVVEILAGAVLALLLQPAPRSSPDGALQPRRAPNPAISGQIRGSL